MEWDDRPDLRTLARHVGPRGEVVLRRRTGPGGAVDELIVNGTFAMDSSETFTERALGEIAIGAIRSVQGSARLLVGGLGLGYTVREILEAADADRLAVVVDVVEIEPCLVDWARDDLTPTLGRVAADPRVRLHTADISAVLAGPRLGAAGPWDAILLDVDNGPDFLIHCGNADLYTEAGLRSAYARLAPTGTLAIWCQGESPELLHALRRVDPRAQENQYTVARGERRFAYVIYTAQAGPDTLCAMTSEAPVSIDGDFRIERDTMGEVRVPAQALWQAQTQRAVENFPISGLPIDPDLIAALGLIKGAAAEINARLGVLTPERADVIGQAAASVAAHEHDHEFPIDVFQTGSGTSSNMNTNEVIGSIASRLLGQTVHPNDHVNASQSSNDVFPSAIHIAATQSLVRTLVPALQHLEDALTAKAVEFAEVVKSGRTHLMDATPVTLGQEFGGYAAQIHYGIDRVEATVPRVAELPLGGTAVGTGINTPPGFATSVIGIIAGKTGLPLTEARNHFEAQGARDALVEASGALRTIAVSLNKIANDLRWMGSGPRAGLGEIALPDLQPGSSIMPGKVNPVICEATTMVCAQVIGNDAAVAFAGASGNFELNVMLPVMARNLLESIRLLANVSRLLADTCVSGIVANVEHCRTLAESSPSIVTPLNRYIGYENAAAVAKTALKEGKTIRDVVLEKGFVTDGSVTEDQLDTALDVLSMTRPPQ